MEKSQENLSAKLKALRALRGKSLEEFSEELQVSKTTLQEIESGKGNPTLVTLQLIAKNLGIPASALLGDTPDTSELLTSQLILSALSFVQSLPEERRTLVFRLFDQLVVLLQPGVESYFNRK